MSRLRRVAWIAGVILIMVISGCAGMGVLVKEKPLISPGEIPREVQPLFARAEEAYTTGNVDEALDLYGTMLTRVHEGSAVALWSHIRRGELFATVGNNTTSIEELRKVVRRFDVDPLYNEARFYLARSYSRLGEYELSEQVARELLREKLSSFRKTELEAVMGDNRLGLGEPYEALSYYMRAFKRKPDNTRRDYLSNRVQNIIDEQLSLEELETARHTYRFGYPSGYILYSLVTRYYKAHEIQQAREVLDRFLRRHKDHPYFEDALKLHERFTEMTLIDRHAIGCLLPLTGRYADYGNRALDAIVLACGVFDSDHNNPIRLVVEDTRSDPEAARNAVVKLSNDDKVIGIIGPLGSMTALEAAKEAQIQGVPLLTLTQRDEITDMGDYIFRNFLTAAMQIRTLVKYSVENLGMTSFAILYPDDTYGVKMMNLFWNEVKQWGGEIRGVESYGVDKTDFSEEIKALTGLNFQKKKTSDETLNPIIDFDALFIPDSWARVSMIAPQLAFYDVTGVQLLGTNAWNSSKLLERDSEYLEGAIFVDGFFRNSYYPAVRNFIDTFYVSYGREPKDMEALAYDAAKIMVDILRHEEVEVRDDVRNKILQVRDYPGITGTTTFFDTRDAQKTLYVLMVRDSEIIQID